MDYFAKAKEALRRSREGQESHSSETDDLPSYLSFLSSLPISDEEPQRHVDDTHSSQNLTHGENTNKTKYTKKEREERQNTQHRRGFIENHPITKNPPGRYEESPPLALRRALRRWFDLSVAADDGQRVKPVVANAVYQQLIRLLDEVGPAFADALILEEHRRFRWETARCGWCGRLGHDLRCER